MAKNCSCVFSIHAIHGDRGRVRPMNVPDYIGISAIHGAQNNDHPPVTG
jgi:hypothetical protein